MGADDECDIAIIGAGQAGVPLALALAKAGRQVALLEEKHLGGSCVNFGCTPTKAAIASAQAAHWARNAEAYGLNVGEVHVDFAAVLRRARKIAEESRDSLARTLAGQERLQLIYGHTRLLGRAGEGFVVGVEAAAARQIRCRQVVLNTGTRTAIPPIAGLDAIDFLHSENWLEHEQLPAHLLVIGGGYIGLEMAQFYRRMGSEVSVVQGANQIAEREDADVAEHLQRCLEAEGIRFHLASQLARVNEFAGAINATLSGAEAGRRIAASHVFIASGRLANTDRLGLESVGLKPGAQGIIAVDQRLATPVKGLWAVGDIRGGPMFTHSSWDDHRIVASQLLGDGARTVERIVPYAMFTDPEIARVGINEAEAQARGMAVKIGRFELRNNGKAREIGRSEGFIKVLIDADNDALIGASLICADAAELIHFYVGVMNAKAPAAVIDKAICIHPTLAEALQSAIASAR